MDNCPSCPPPHPLRGAARCRHSAVWGFPIDTAVIIANFKKTVPPNDAAVGPELALYTSNISGELRKKCREIWSSPGMISSPVHVYSPGKSNKFIIALLRSTRPDDSLLPPPDKLEELKAVFVAEGFPGEPDWFTEVS